MGQPEDACFKQKSPFISFTTTTTTSTTLEPDFFILPNSGAQCPSLSELSFQALLPSGNLTFTCNSNIYYETCIIDTSKYIRVADIDIDYSRCKKYRLTLSGSDKNSFFIHNFKLYIKGEVLDFDQPTKCYDVTIELRNSDTLNIIDTVNHSVCVDPCICSSG